VGRAGEGVLKRRLPEWLSEPDIRPLVSGFAPAHRVHGGAGAFYVFIKRAD
jgi:DNA-nicking Smr family endonuclease